MTAPRDPKMATIVKAIISKVPKGFMFDSHYVIDTVIRDRSDDYLRFVSKCPAKSEVTEYAHGQLAKVISSFEAKMVEKQETKSYSFNIRGKASECALWKRL